jgi:hypothetical protein
MALPKYRPYLTLPQIDAIVSSLGEYVPQPHSQEIKEAITALRLLQIKAETGVVGSAYVSTGNKPGKVSAVDLVKETTSFMGDLPVPTMTYEEAVYQNSIWPHSLQPLPANIQAILDKGEE